MNARWRTRLQLFAFLAVVTALLVATFTRPSRHVRDAADSEIVSASTDSGHQAAHEERTRYSGAYSGGAATVSRAEPALSERQVPVDPAEYARRREERLALRAEQRASWEEHKREASSSARARALELAKDDPEQLEYLKAQFVRRDEHDRLHEERRQERRKRREERAARPGDATPHVSETPVLGPPVIGEDGVAYDPHARAH